MNREAKKVWFASLRYGVDSSDIVRLRIELERAWAFLEEIRRESGAVQPNSGQGYLAIVNYVHKISNKALEE